MNKPLEVLLDARKTLNGVHSEDSASNVASAVDSILDYLFAKEAAEELCSIGKQIDKAQAARDISKASALMVERDKILALMK
jgi:hypothetical protein